MSKSSSILALNLLMILIILIIPAQSISYEDSPNVVWAEDILSQIKRGEAIEYDQVIIGGDLDLNKADLPTIERDWFDSERLGLKESVKVVNSTIVITNSTIQGRLNFNDTIFQKPINFWASNFGGETKFEGAQFNGEAYFGETSFNRKAEYPFVHFEDSANFESAKFGEEAIFIGAQFQGNADFWNSQFIAATFIGSQFDEKARFEGARFEGKANFAFTQFAKDAWFDFIRFDEEANFRGAQFEENTDFSYTNFNNNFTLADSKFNRFEVKWSAIKNKLICDGSAYLGLIKNFKDLEQFDDADNCYYQYRKKSQEQKEIGWSKLIDVLSWLSCGYGVRPGNTIFMSLFLISLFGGVFLMGKAIQRTTDQYNTIYGPEYHKNRRVSLDDVWEALYFSLLVFTFQAARGDLFAEGKYKYAAVIEAIIGLLLIGLFVVTLGNIMIRY